MFRNKALFFFPKFLSLPSSHYIPSLSCFATSGQNYYQLLGIPQSASQAEIKAAYYKLAKKYHPDVYKGGEEVFKSINSAYETLSDTSKKRSYDDRIRYGGTGTSSSSSSTSSSYSSGFRQQQQQQQYYNQQRQQQQQSQYNQQYSQQGQQQKYYKQQQQEWDQEWQKVRQKWEQWKDQQQREWEEQQRQKYYNQNQSTEQQSTRSNPKGRTYNAYQSYNRYGRRAGSSTNTGYQSKNTETEAEFQQGIKDTRLSLIKIIVGTAVLMFVMRLFLSVRVRQDWNNYYDQQREGSYQQSPYTNQGYGAPPPYQQNQGGSWEDRMRREKFTR